MMTISVVIPTHDRPDFLREAIASVVAQGDGDWQLVVVDDGSRPAVDAASLGGRLGNRFVFVRHEVAQGIARAKNAGVRAATGEIITILDDDDLLAPTALEAIRAAFITHPELDCLFLGVEPFGPYAPGVAEARQKAIAPFVDMAAASKNGLCFFDERLFSALVNVVPIDFQRPAARKGAWNMIGLFDEAGLFSESAWAIRASAGCRVALATESLIRWRIHDANFGWLDGASQAANQLRQTDNSVASAIALVERYRREHATAGRRLRLLEASLADRYFDKAHLLRDRPSAEAWGTLVRSMVIRPRLRHLKLMARYLLPTSAGTDHVAKSPSPRAGNGKD